MFDQCYKPCGKMDRVSNHASITDSLVKRRAWDYYGAAWERWLLFVWKAAWWLRAVGGCGGGTCLVRLIGPGKWKLVMFLWVGTVDPANVDRSVESTYNRASMTGRQAAWTGAVHLVWMEMQEHGASRTSANSRSVGRAVYGLSANSS